MKLLLSVLAIALVFPAVSVRRNPQNQNDCVGMTDYRNDVLTHPDRIVPSVRAGRVHLGESRERFIQQHPLKANMDQEATSPGCRDEINWLDVGTGGRVRGNLFVWFDNHAVVQIESATPRYRTREGIGAGDSPHSVGERYPGLRAHALGRGSVEVFGGRPLIFWMDDIRGIAFKLAYSKTERRRYIYSVIIFPAGGKFYPENCGVSDEEWRELPPYATSAK
jgi:hypothetical protein